MTCRSLELHNREQIGIAMDGDVWVVACLCAAWCDVCREFRPDFEALARRHPDKFFVWIDIEDQADVVGDFDVEDFPTLLIQRADTVVFFGAVLPDSNQVHRLLTAQAGRSTEELALEAKSSPQRIQWQNECNLRQRIAAIEKE